MDRTSIDLGSKTRDALKEYKAEQELESYNVAVQELLEEQGVTVE